MTKPSSHLTPQHSNSLTQYFTDGHVFHQYTIRVLNGKRNALEKHLKEKGIDTMVYYPVPLHLQEALKDGSGPGLITSPEGKPAYEGAKPPPPPPPPPANPAIAFTTQGRERSKSYSYLKVMTADGTNVTTILRSEYIQSGAINGPISWAPGGGSIAFVRGVSGLWLIDVTVVNGVPTASNTRLLVPRTWDSIFNPAWSSLGDRIAFTRSSRTIEAVPVTGGEPVQLIRVVQLG